MPTLFTSPATLSGLPPATPLLVAFSGGADSRLLLELTVDWARANGAPVTAAHLHHGIRGAEADRDEAFCRGVAAAHGIRRMQPSRIPLLRCSRDLYLCPSPVLRP